jgi:hypothetical protein
MQASLIVAGVFAFAGVACAGGKGDGLFGTGGGPGGGTAGDNTPDTGSAVGGSAAGAGGDTGGSASTGGTPNVGGGNVTGTGGTPGGGGAAGARDASIDSRLPTIEAGLPALDAADEAGGDRTVACRGAACTVGTEQCCEANNAMCVPLGGVGGNCPVNAPRLRCDDARDCMAGQVCCATPMGGGMNSDLARCLGANNCPVGNGSQILCDPAANNPCPGQVNVCSVAQNAIFPNRPFCHP